MPDIRQYDNLPAELKTMPNWVCWSGDKLPKNPRTGGNAMSNNPTTWGSFEQAVDATTKYKFDGIGFMFSEPYFGVDLDKCMANVDFVDEFVDTLQSYTEFSKSGNGIHIICRGSLPEGSRRKDNVEMYSSGRFFIMTGNIYKPEYAKIRECTDTIKILHSKYLGSTPSSTQPMEFERLDLDDTEIIDKARMSKSGPAFQTLYAGNWEGTYSSQSEADLALCNILAFWTQKDEVQMDRIFRSSGLWREKWDKKHGDYTYGYKTIQKAIADCREVYTKNLEGRESSLVVSGKPHKARTAKTYEFSDTGNGLRFFDDYGAILRYSHTHQRWYYWDDKRWCGDETNQVKRLADLSISKMRDEAWGHDDHDTQKALLKWADRTANTKPKENMINEAKHQEGIAIKDDYFDRQPNLINVQNGVIDLTTQKLIPHDPELQLSRICYTDYAGDTALKPKRWLQFLDEITNGDRELQYFLQKAIGYSLTGSIKEQVLFICYGNGCNGKSTFMDVVTTLMGSYALNMQAESIMVRKTSSSANTDIARLSGSRFVTVSEPEEGVRLNESLVKQLTGNDRITARFLYGREFEFKPEFKLWISTNHKPIIRGTDDGIWRRIILVPFTVKIPQEKIDKNLALKLREELPLIMAWAVDGCRYWQQEGLGRPGIIQTATDEYRSEMDVLSKFVSDCVEDDTTPQNIGVRASEIYKIYEEWARQNNEFCMTATRFGKEFLLRYPEKYKTRDGAYYRGCILTNYAKQLVEGKSSLTDNGEEYYWQKN